MVRRELFAMSNTNLQYYVTSPKPERIIELRNEIAQARDPQALLSAAYKRGKGWGADFWAATAIEYPCYYVWFHSRVPLSEEVLAEQTRDLSRQAGLARAKYVELPVMVFGPEAVIAVQQEDAPALEGGPGRHQDFHVWSAQVPRALVRVGCCEPHTQLDHEALESYAQLIGLHLATILSQPDSGEAVEIVGSGERLDQETFFECVELALAEVHRRAGELSLLALEIKPRDEAAVGVVSTEDWHRIWQQISGQLRHSDLVGQVVTGSYIIAMPLTNDREALTVADRIRQKLDQLADQGLVPMTVSMGISNWSAGRPGMGQLLWEARESMRMAAISGSAGAFIYV